MTVSRPGIAVGAPLAGVPAPVLGAVAAAWAAAIAAEATGAAGSLHHDSLLEGGPGFGPALVLFLVAWQVMVAAMMVPSSLPLVRMYSAATIGTCTPPTRAGASVAARGVKPPRRGSRSPSPTGSRFAR